MKERKRGQESRTEVLYAFARLGGSWLISNFALIEYKYVLHAKEGCSGNTGIFSHESTTVWLGVFVILVTDWSQSGELMSASARTVRAVAISYLFLDGSRKSTPLWRTGTPTNAWEVVEHLSNGVAGWCEKSTH